MTPASTLPVPARPSAWSLRPRRAVAVVLLAAVLPLAACSDEASSPGPAPAPAEPTETSQEGGSQSPSADDAATEDPAATPSATDG